MGNTKTRNHSATMTIRDTSKVLKQPAAQHRKSKAKLKATASAKEQRRLIRDQERKLRRGEIPAKINLFDFELAECFELQMLIATAYMKRSGTTKRTLSGKVAYAIINDTLAQIEMSAPYGELGMRSLDGAYKMAVVQVTRTNILLSEQQRANKHLQPHIEAGKRVAAWAIEKAGRLMWGQSYQMHQEPELLLAS